MTPIAFLYFVPIMNKYDYDKRALSKDIKIIDYLLENGLDIKDEKLLNDYKKWILLPLEKVKSSDKSNIRIIEYLKRKKILS